MPNNAWESLLASLALIRPLDCGVRMVSFTLGSRKQKKENNIIVGGKKYICTPELWELIVATTPDDNIFTNEITIIMLK